MRNVDVCPLSKSNKSKENKIKIKKKLKYEKNNGSDLIFSQFRSQGDQVRSLSFKQNHVPLLKVFICF